MFCRSKEIDNQRICDRYVITGFVIRLPLHILSDEKRTAVSLAAGVS